MLSIKATISTKLKLSRSKVSLISADTYPHALGLARKLGKEYPSKKIVMFDERYTSVLAQRSLVDSGVPKMGRRDKAAVDKVSAAIILQGFMESRMYNELK